MLKARAHANVSQECAEEIAAAEVANAGGDGAGELVAKQEEAFVGEVNGAERLRPGEFRGRSPERLLWATESDWREARRSSPRSMRLDNLSPSSRAFLPNRVPV